jgi:hypothetical protein
MRVGSNSKNGKTFGKDNAGNEIVSGSHEIQTVKIYKRFYIRLGVVVTEDINTTASNKLRTSSAMAQALGASVMNTGIIYGGTSTVPDKRKNSLLYKTTLI